MHIPWTFFVCINLNLPLSSVFFALGILQLHCKLKSEFRSSITSFYHCFHLQHRERTQKICQTIKFKSCVIYLKWRNREVPSLCNKCRTMYVLWPMFCGLCGMGWIFYLSRANNDAVIAEHSFLCWFDILQINSATAIINQYRPIASRQWISCCCT